MEPHTPVSAFIMGYNIMRVQVARQDLHNSAMQ